jgi:molybdopterin/thiamine biosynthesis adenylyltransferase
MSGVRFVSSDFAAYREGLLADRTQETCGVAYACHDAAAGSWVVASAELAPEGAYERRDRVHATLKPAFLVEVANRARREGLSVILTHTHPWAAGTPAFSAIDDAGEVEVSAYLDRRAAEGAHLAMVMGTGGCRARRLGSGFEIPVWEVGERLVLRSGSAAGTLGDDRHDRQIRAFGVAGQQVLQGLRVGVVGAGGTGSATLQQLAHLGVADFTVLDPDRVEPSNLNRLVGSVPGDVGRAKVEIAERMIHGINPEAMVRALQSDVVDGDVAPQLFGLDALFLCTDSHASRAVVGQLAYQHLVPTFDMGVSITVRDGAVTHVTGRVQMLSPGLPCLTCTGALDSEQIRRELLTPEQRRADPYVDGANEPQPAVISLNSTMASLAVTMFLGAVTPAPAAARFQFYDGVRGTVRATRASQVESCIVCSTSGALARGGSWPLPVRQMGPRHG